MYDLYEYIRKQIPVIDGYGEAGKEIDENLVSNHDVFFQSIRDDHEGDIGIFIIDGSEDTKLMFGEIYESEIQIVVNSVDGELKPVLELLQQLLKNIRNNNRDENIYVMNCGLINLRPVGKNSNGIQWSVMNILCKYSKLQNNK